MNQREKMLLVLFLVIAGGGGGMGACYQWIYKPLKTLDKNLAELRQGNDLRSLEIAKFREDQRKMEQARVKSLPPSREAASAEYMAYLQPLLRDSGLTVETISPQSAGEFKLSAMPTGVKKISHQVLTFQVRAKGELKALVRALAVLQKTPYEHRVKNLTIDRDVSSAKDTGGKLTINMAIETLLIAPGKTKNDSTQVALEDRDPVPVPDNRRYEDIAKKNIFVGALPYVPPPPPEKDPPSTELEPTPPPKEDVPRYIRLVTTLPGQKTAFLRNLVFKQREMKLMAQPRSGYDIFLVTDEEGDYVFFKAKMLRVDDRDIYFQVKNQVYAMHIGQSLADSMEYPLTIDQIDDMDLSEVYDREWAKKEMAGDKKTTPTKKTGGKGFK